MTKIKTIPLYPDHTWSAKQREAWHSDMEDLERRIKRNEDVYFEFHDRKRENSIASYGGGGFTEDRTYSSWSIGPRTPTKRTWNNWFQVKWKGRSRHIQVYNSEVNWLKGYEGETVWAWNPKPDPILPKVTPVDRTGKEIKVGDFCCYVLHHFQKSGASTRFGSVTKIEHDGTVWAKNVKVVDEEQVAEKRINDNDTVVVLTKDLLDRLMMLRLSTS